MFSRRHYVFLARFFRREYELAKDSDHTRAMLVLSLSRLLVGELFHDNPNFDKTRFCEAVEKGDN